MTQRDIRDHSLKLGVVDSASACARVLPIFPFSL